VLLAQCRHLWVPLEPQHRTRRAGAEMGRAPRTRVSVQWQHELHLLYVHHALEITVQRLKRTLRGFQSFTFFYLICLRVRAGEVTKHITMDDSKVRVSTKLWSLFLTQHFQLQNTGQIQGYFCHTYLGGDNHETKGIRVHQRYGTYIINITAHLLNTDLFRPISSLTK